MAKKKPKATAVENQKNCGLIMPISARDGLSVQHWNDVRSIIVRALLPLNLNVRLVSDGEASDVIHKTILQRLVTEDVCICDTSTLNPNVMFELGVRLSFSMPTVIIGDDATDFPFDISPIRRIDYPRGLRYTEIKRFMARLRKAVESSLEAKLKGDNSNSLMSLLSPILVPKLEKSEVPGMEFIVSELKELRAAVAVRNAPPPTTAPPPNSPAMKPFPSRVDAAIKELIDNDPALAKFAKQWGETTNQNIQRHVEMIFAKRLDQKLGYRYPRSDISEGLFRYVSRIEPQ